MTDWMGELLGSSPIPLTMKITDPLDTISPVRATVMPYQTNFKRDDLCYMYQKKWRQIKSVHFYNGFSVKSIVFGILRDGLFLYHEPKQDLKVFPDV